ncbi:Crp/Fnr family transcriptional regulator [Beggiatoa alba]|nr:Crp/Fnr family transcriptional regulator [Beggiatoa alba]
MKNSALISLDKTNLDKFKSYSILHLYNKHDFVFQAGTLKKNFHLLLSGRVKLYRVSSLGREVTQWFCFPGEAFGLAELAHKNQQSIYAQCCEQSEVLAIPLNQFNHFIKNSPEIAVQIIEQLSVRLKITGDTLLNFTSDDIKTRLVKLLTRLNMRFGTEYNNGILINVILTHKEIANMIGACRQSVTTALGELKTAGYLKIINHHFFIPSMLAFEKLADIPKHKHIKKDHSPELSIF